MLPFDFTREVPTSALKWLLQFEIPYSYWKEQGIGYSPQAERLIFTVGKPNVAFSIGRYVGDKERYDDGKRIPKWRTYGDPHKHCEIISPRGLSEHCEIIGEGDSVILVEPKQVVLVEDLISAHKVAYSGHTTIPLFGTTVHRPVIYYLISCNRSIPIYLWLDKDQELNVKAKALELESIINKPVKVITTDKDPKWLSKEEINEELS